MSKAANMVNVIMLMNMTQILIHENFVAPSIFWFHDCKILCFVLLNLFFTGYLLTFDCKILYFPLLYLIFSLRGIFWHFRVNLFRFQTTYASQIHALIKENVWLQSNPTKPGRTNVSAHRRSRENDARVSMSWRKLLLCYWH